LGDNISEEEQWAKVNTNRKSSPYTEKDCFEKSQNYCNTGDSLNIHPEDPVSIKTV
jgi:hypothetical protein